jgi:hypothetical protein
MTDWSSQVKTQEEYPLISHRKRDRYKQSDDYPTRQYFVRALQAAELGQRSPQVCTSIWSGRWYSDLHSDEQLGIREVKAIYTTSMRKKSRQSATGSTQTN